MRIAHQFGRHDVDAFLDEITADQFAEWSEYFAVEPTGWTALAIAIQRITFVTAQSHTQKTLKERDYAIKFGRQGNSQAVEHARWEAFAIQQEVAANLAALTGEGGLDG